MKIVGAGLAGLIAAHIFPQAAIVEANGEPREAHKALLRFRSPEVSRVTGIDFRRVTVRKGVWYDGAFHEPNIRLANLYSRKVVGELAARSIWDVETVERYIAPLDFYQRMLDHVGGRVQWATPFQFPLAGEEPVISTAPMPQVLSGCGIDSDLSFKSAPIYVKRFHVTDSDVHQTVYFPTRRHSMYRASITGDLLIAEFAGEPSGGWLGELKDAFALMVEDFELIEDVQQRYGKIAPVDDLKRKSAIGRLTANHNIYSLGRFATWRNILLDDVVDDANQIKRLMDMGEYERRLASMV